MRHQTRRAGLVIKKRKRISALTATLLLAVSFTFPLFNFKPASALTLNAPTTAHAVCGNTELLAGPAVAPEGAITVPAGNNGDMFYDMRAANTTFWFAPGVHTLGTDEYDQIQPGNGSTFIGAPGAVLDGQHANRYAFTQEATGVRIAHLEIINFGRTTPENGGASNNDEGVVNHDSGANWTIDHNYVHDNDGAGVFMGTGNNVNNNCLKDNGQYGASAYHRDDVSNVTFADNEVTGNNTDDWESRREGCGCTGGMKFWATTGATITGNWVHDNRGTGIWADYNNSTFDIENNYIEENDGTGLFYEVSYNFLIKDNTFKRNAIVTGKQFADRTDSFPVGAIYISESGGDSRAGSQYVQSEITGNDFKDNWGGVILWENADRFCRPNEEFDTTNNCPPFDQTWGTRYKTQNIDIHNNRFSANKEAIDCDSNYCARQAIFSNYGTSPTNSPYLGTTIQDAITYNQDNHWFDNEYHGPWLFTTYEPSRMVGFTEWQASPYSQDANSTFDGPTESPNQPPSNPGNNPPASGQNDLDADTATIEGSRGKWDAWFSTNIAQSTDAAHGGTHSLRVDTTEPYGWGVNFWNWPGITSGHGVKQVSFWAKLGTSSTNVRPELKVQWLDANGDIVKEQAIRANALTDQWQQTKALVDVPAGAVTAFASMTGSEDAGVTMYFDDFTIGDAPNLYDKGTASAEDSVGDWRDWYSATIIRATDQAYKGNGSFRIDVTDPWSWGAQPWNWPGVSASAGVKHISYWAKQGTSGVGEVTLTITWHDANQDTLRTDEVTIDGLTSNWKEGVANVDAPAGTVSAHLELHSPDGEAGDYLYVDDIVVTDA